MAPVIPLVRAASLVAVWLCAGVGWAAETTVSVYLPGYDASDWKALRGSVIKSDKSITTYTIFCAQQTPPTCVLDDTLPFLFAEGPGSLSFGGAIPGQITADLRCDLAGTTAAACSGYSSTAPGFHPGPVTEPSETTWTSTYSGSDVEWGALTLTSAPTTTLTPNLDATGLGTGSINPTRPLSPTSTAGAEAGRRLGGGRVTLAFISGGAILAGILLQ